MSRKQDVSVFPSTRPLSSGALRLSLGGHAVMFVVTPFANDLGQLPVMSNHGSSGPYRRSNGDHESREPRRHDDASTRDSNQLGVLIGEARGCQPGQPVRFSALSSSAVPGNDFVLGCVEEVCSSLECICGLGQEGPEDVEVVDGRGVQL